MWQRNSTVDRNGKQNLPRGQISALDRRSGLRVLVFKSKVVARYHGNKSGQLRGITRFVKSDFLRRT